MLDASHYLILADLTLILHAVVVTFVVLGQVVILVGWRADWRLTANVPLRVLHLVLIVFVAFESWMDIPCSLTVLENRLRTLAGAEPYDTTFIAHWLGRVLFYEAPDWVFVLAYSAFAALVAATFVLYPPHRLSRR